MIEIKKEQCVGCGACVRVCPTALLRMKENKPKAVHKLCMHCGHCQGVCPTDAILFQNIKGTPKVVEEKVGFSQLQNHIESNRSIRFYQDKLVEQEKIKTILRVLDHSASAKNNQLVEWIVVSGKEKVQEISDLVTQNLPPNHEDRKSVV